MKSKMASREEVTVDTSDSKVENEEDNSGDNEESEPPSKKAKLKGRNKQRPRNERIMAKDKMCPAVKENRDCKFGDNCKFNHDKKDFLSKKLPELDGGCYLFDTFGYCQYGITCRFAGNHLTENFQNLVKDDLFEKMKSNKKFLNELDSEVRQKLWKKKYNFKRADGIVKDVQKNFRGWGDKTPAEDRTAQSNLSDSTETVSSTAANGEASMKVETLKPEKEDQISPIKLEASSVSPPLERELQIAKSEEASKPQFGCITDEEVIRIRSVESKKVSLFFFKL